MRESRMGEVKNRIIIEGMRADRAERIPRPAFT